MSLATDINRRRSPRAPISVRVSAMMGAVDAPIALGRATNISIHGMFIEVQLTTPEHKMALGEIVSVRFHPPTSDRLIVASAMIARLEHKGAATSGIGIDFQELETKDRSSIERYVRENLPQFSP